MKISIITVSYNSEATIEFAIKSVLSQTYKNIEYIIVDGGSKDSTQNIVRSFGNRIHVFVSEPDKGIYDAMNKGIRLATGDVIGILNSDDLYADNEVISDVMSGFSQNPSVDMLYGNLVYVKKDDTDKIVRKWDSRPYYAGFFEAGNVPPHTSLFLKRNVFDIVGVFNLQYKLAADYEFMLRAFKKYHFRSVYINRLMVKMRLGGATNKSIKNILEGNKEILKAWKENQLNAPLSLMPLRIIKRVRQFF
jgi:glycosyltransferase involved in cell wall biosynthesis